MGPPNYGTDVIPSEGAKRRSRGIAIVLAERLSIGTAAIPRLAALARNDTILRPSEGAKRRSRGIAIVLAERLSIGTAAIPRLAALARNDKCLAFSHNSKRAPDLAFT